MLIIPSLYEVLNPVAGQNSFNLASTLAGPLTMDKYSQIIKPFMNLKSAPDNLSNEIQSKGNTEAVIMILDKSGIIKHISNKFFLSSMQIQLKEKVQLMETFGSANISFFGESARIYVFQAATVDAPSQDSGTAQGKYFYQSSIIKMYNDVLRGSQLIKSENIAVMKVSNHIIYGYPLNLSVGYNADNSPVTIFSLQFIVAEHTLEMPGVVTDNYLKQMFSPDSVINNEKIFEFLKKIDDILIKIDKVLNTEVSAISKIENGYYGWYTYPPLQMKQEYISLLMSNMGALQTAFGSTLNGEISPLVHSKIPPKTLDRLMSLIPSMFDDEETFNLVATNMRNLLELKRELNMFKFYRINSDNMVRYTDIQPKDPYFEQTKTFSMEKIVNFYKPL